MSFGFVVADVRCTFLYKVALSSYANLSEAHRFHRVLAQ